MAKPSKLPTQAHQNAVNAWLNKLPPSQRAEAKQRFKANHTVAENLRDYLDWLRTT